MEYIVVKFDDENERATVSLRADDLLPKLQEKEHADPQSNQSLYLFLQYSLLLSNIH